MGPPSACQVSYIFFWLSLQVMFYEALKDLTRYGKQKWAPDSNYGVGSSFEGLLLGGLAGGKFCNWILQLHNYIILLGLLLFG